MIIFLYTIDYFIQEGLKTSNYREVSKWNEIIEGGIDANILIVGSSRALVHFDCDMIEEATGNSCYNLGFDGTNYILQKKMLDLYLESNQLPKTIVWNVDFNSFELKDEFYGFEQLIPFRDKKTVRELLEMNKGFNHILYYLPIIRYTFNSKMKIIGLLNYFNLYSKGPGLSKGYKKQNKNWDGIFEKVRENNNNERFIYEVDDFLFKDFEDELYSLNKRGVEIQLIISPIYYSAKDMVANVDSITSRIRYLSRINKYSFFDYSSDSIVYDKKYFYNGNHLNSKGVFAFMNKFLSK